MTSPEPDRLELFDAWAADYDPRRSTDAYPFAGYDDVIAAVVVASQIEPGHRVLDLGCGTGNLTARLADRAGEVWGTDFSTEMLHRAKRRVPRARFARHDLRAAWPPGLPARFDRIVSTYVLHEFDDEEKVRLLADLAHDRLAPDGRLVIGDVAFPDEKALTACRKRWPAEWDETEHYWVADRIAPRLEAANLTLEHEQISCCGGLFVVRPGGAA